MFCYKVVRTAPLRRPPHGRYSESQCRPDRRAGSPPLGRPSSPASTPPQARSSARRCAIGRSNASFARRTSSASSSCGMLARPAGRRSRSSASAQSPRRGRGSKKPRFGDRDTQIAGGRARPGRHLDYDRGGQSAGRRRGHCKPSLPRSSVWLVIPGWDRGARTYGRRRACWLRDPIYERRPDTDDGQVDAVEIVRVVDGRRDLATLF